MLLHTDEGEARVRVTVYHCWVLRRLLLKRSMLDFYNVQAQGGPNQFEQKTFSLEFFLSKWLCTVESFLGNVGFFVCNENAMPPFT